MSGVNVQLGLQYKVIDIVAHADRMQLLDEVIRYDHEKIVVALTVRENTEFYVPGVGVPAWVGIEYMAQAVGAFSGIEEVQSGKPPQIGLLLGSRRCTSDVSEFRLGDRLEVTAHLQMRDESDLAVFHCEIAIAGKTVARGDLKAIRPHNVEELIAAQAAENNQMQKL